MQYICSLHDYLRIRFVFRAFEEIIRRKKSITQRLRNVFVSNIKNRDERE